MIFGQDNVSTRELGATVVESRLSEYNISFKRRHGRHSRVSYELFPRNGGRTSLIKIYSEDGEFFRISRALLTGHIDYVIYIWNVNEAPNCFLLDINDAFEILGPFALKTKSWLEMGYYSWSGATGLPKHRKAVMEENFCERWEWLYADIEKQDISRKQGATYKLAKQLLNIGG
jgi:hypothetical protein